MFRKMFQEEAALMRQETEAKITTMLDELERDIARCEPDIVD